MGFLIATVGAGVFGTSISGAMYVLALTGIFGTLVARAVGLVLWCSS
jgi:hypothetical protein